MGLIYNEMRRENDFVYVSTLYFVAVIVSTSVTSACVDNTDDPCLPENYRELDDGTRSSKYKDADSPYRGDYSLQPLWYRSVNSAGGDMPTAAPEPFHCQATNPIWLDGTLPVEADGIVERRACARRYANNCLRDYTVCVKDCGNFNVYYLPTTESSADRYCFGSEVLCPQGQSSWTGYTPNCGVVNDVLTEDPQVDYMIRETNIYQDTCEDRIDYTCNINHDNEAILLWVQWTVDDEVISENTTPYAELPAILTHTELAASGVKSYGFTVTCTMRPLTQDGIPGDPRTGDFYAGYQVHKTVLNVREDGNSDAYVVDFTVPFTCEHTCKEKGYICRLTVNVVIPVYDAETGETTTCQDGDKNKQIVFSRAKSFNGDGEFCTSEVLLHPNDQDEIKRMEIPVYARKDGRYDGDHELALQVKTSKLNDADPFWGNIAFTRAQVFVVDADYSIAGKSCQYYHDPHAWTFELRRFEMQLEGFFTLYRHTSLPIEVQGYFQKVTRWSKVCGVAIRSGGDLYVVNYCDKRGFYNKFYECEELGLGVPVQDLKVVVQGSTYTVTLPTGGRVQFSSSRIQIFPSLADWGNTEGQCGSLNGNPGDDFKHKDSGITDNSGTTAFSNSWRVPDEQSLFYGKIKDERQFNDVVFCGCDKAGSASCGYTEALTNCVSKGNDVTDKMKRLCGLNKRKKREVVYTDDVDDAPEDPHFPYDPNFVPSEPEWQNGWTEETATTFCEDYFSPDKTVVKLCRNVAGVNIENSIDDCIEDIHISGSAVYAADQMGLIVAQCVHEVEKNDTLFQSNTVTGSISVAEEILNQLCPNDCMNNGECVEGECRCHADFTGLDCSYNANHVPELFGLPSDSQCDQLHRPCRSTPVYGDLFIEGENLLCHVKILNVDMTSEGTDEITAAEYHNFQRVRCSIPEVDPPFFAGISITNNNQDFSEATLLLVHNSICWSCNHSMGCTKKASSCVIAGGCYSEDETNPKNSKQTCQPKASQWEWSDLTTTSANLQSSSNTETNPRTTPERINQGTRTSFADSTQMSGMSFTETHHEGEIFTTETTQPPEISTAETTQPSETSTTETTQPSEISTTETTQPPETSTTETTQPPETSTTETTKPSEISTTETTQPPETSTTETTQPPETSTTETTQPLETSTAETTQPLETSTVETAQPSETSTTETTQPSEISATETTQPPETSTTETTQPLETSTAETTQPLETSTVETAQPSETSTTETTQPSEISATETTQPPETSTTETTQPPDISTTETTQPSEISTTETTQPPEISATETTQPPETSTTETTQPPDISTTETTQPSEISTTETTQPPETSTTETTQPPETSTTETTQPLETSTAETTQPLETSTVETAQPSETSTTETTQPSEISATETTQPPETSTTETTQPLETSTAETTQPLETSTVETAQPSETSTTETTQPSEISATETTQPPETSTTETTQPPDISTTETTQPSEISTTETTQPPEISATETTQPPETSTTETTQPPDISTTETTQPSEISTTEATQPSETSTTETTQPSETSTTETTYGSHTVTTEINQHFESYPTWTKNNMGAVVGATVGGVLAVVIIIALVLYCKKRSSILHKDMDLREIIDEDEARNRSIEGTNYHYIAQF